MNPKDMTDEELVKAVIPDILWPCNDSRILLRAELLCRIGEADALRKENDELASALRVCKTWFQMHGMQTFNHMECGIADDALSHRMSRLAKESEASHE